MCFLAAPSKWPTPRRKIVFSKPNQQPATVSEIETNPFPVGSVYSQLWETCHVLRSIKREEEQEKRAPTVAVQATKNGNSAFHQQSIRRKIHEFIVSNGRTTVEDVETFLRREYDIHSGARGHLQKLIEAKHLEAVK